MSNLPKRWLHAASGNSVTLRSFFVSHNHVPYQSAWNMGRPNSSLIIKNKIDTPVFILPNEEFFHQHHYYQQCTGSSKYLFVHIMPAKHQLHSDRLRRQNLSMTELTALYCQPLHTYTCLVFNWATQLLHTKKRAMRFLFSHVCLEGCFPVTYSFPTDTEAFSSSVVYLHTILHKWELDSVSDRSKLF